MPYRLFVAIELPNKIRQQLIGMRGDIPGAAWTKPNAFHLTLRFLGDDIEVEKLDALKTALTAVRGEPFRMWLKGVGRFPPHVKNVARVLWVGVKESPELDALYQQIEAQVTQLGFAPETRAFHPHITLARLKLTKPDASVDQFFQEYADYSSAPMRVAEFHLISSTLIPQGADYETQATIALRGS